MFVTTASDGCRYRNDASIDDSFLASLIFVPSRRSRGALVALAASAGLAACTSYGLPLIVWAYPRGEDIERKGGQTQVTYNGMPLYYYAKDQGPGTATGQDVQMFLAICSLARSVLPRPSG